MGSGKNMEKESTSPMFPRLSLNDSEEGGRKAPPRNKMALYEQLNHPSLRLILPSKGSHLVPSKFSSHEGGGHHERSFTAEKPHSYSFNTIEFKPANQSTKFCENNENDNGNASETSVVDCCLNISPDDVVSVIGDKEFWEARKVLVNQQKLFDLQVFELHRLIKVQKALSRSPHLLLEHNFMLSKSILSTSSNQNIKPKVQSRELSSVTKNMSDNVVTTTLSDIFLAAPQITEGPTPPWHYNPPPPLPPLPPLPINQWLIPIMSPSQGLVYKPYPPPVAGFMPPVYRNSHTFYPPPFGSPENELDSQFSARDSKESEALGSTETSPSETEQGEVMPLFPMEPKTHKPKTRVIKVIPHNPKLATESAARIFRSIQEERKSCAV